MKKQDEKVEIRLRIPKLHHDILQEYCRLYGTTPSAALCGYIWDVLGRFLVKSLTRVDILSKNININYSAESAKSGKSNSKPRKKKATAISDDFDPPKSITDEEGLNHKLAVDMFIDWAKSNGHLKADWIATFRNACRGWLKDRVPQNKDEWKGIKRV
tara:strand:- start:1049 stop:1522 length:474 start_codon:yes stop_codon:yes gene_type:complete